MGYIYKKTKNGTTYVYDNVSYWRKDIKQPRSKRKLIGKLDPDTGEIIPTSGRGRKRKVQPDSTTVVVTTASSAPKASGSGSQNSDDLRYQYEECRRKLLETQAELAKARSQADAYRAEVVKFKADLESFFRKYH
ncbi:MAG: hypothetical protein LKE85_02965 [Lachnospiraceae bacterium]|nr:hypothetical protein [Lachnospiraceae bacterium]